MNEEQKIKPKKEGDKKLNQLKKTYQIGKNQRNN